MNYTTIKFNFSLSFWKYLSILVKNVMEIFSVEKQRYAHHIKNVTLDRLFLIAHVSWFT